MRDFSAFFDANEVALNRTGKLSERQRLAGEATGNGGGLFFIGLSGLLVAGGGVGSFLFYDSLREPISRVDLNAVYAIAAGGALLGLGALAIGINSLRSSALRRRLFALGTCEGVELTFDIPAQKQNFADGFLLATERHRVFIARDLGRVFKQGARYRLYLVGNELVGVEPL